MKEFKTYQRVVWLNDRGHGPKTRKVHIKRGVFVGLVTQRRYRSWGPYETIGWLAHIAIDGNRTWSKVNLSQLVDEAEWDSNQTELENEPQSVPKASPEVEK